MSKLSIIAAIVCSFGVLSGFLFFDICEAFYEFENGPPLVEPGFVDWINSSKRSQKSTKAFESFGISGWKLKDTFTYKKDYSGGRDLYLFSELKNGKYKVFGLKLKEEDGSLVGTSNGLIILTEMNCTELNKYIDQLVFSNKTERAKAKKVLLAFKESN